MSFDADLKRGGSTRPSITMRRGRQHSRANGACSPWIPDGSTLSLLLHLFGKRCHQKAQIGLVEWRSEPVGDSGRAPQSVISTTAMTGL